jgi:hypothetical protein
MSDYPSADECRERLERAGFRVREVSRHTAAGVSWGVFADRDGKTVWGFGPTQADAWRDARRRAEALGLLPPE